MNNSHEPIASMVLNGEEIAVGRYRHVQGDSLYLKHRDLTEPCYLSNADAKLLIAALKAAMQKDA